MPKKPAAPLTVDDLNHPGATRPNIPTQEAQPNMSAAQRAPLRVEYARRNADLDPQLVWRGKLEADAASLFVDAAPLYIQEKIHPKALVDDLLRHTRQQREQTEENADDAFQPSLFADQRADFNGLPPDADRTAWYAHQQNWTNRMILGDSLRVMASLAEREGLRGQVQCIYLDPPYGIKFNSNFQWSTTSRDVKDGNASHITREPEQVRAFRDTWRDGIHSYLSYLRERLIVARDLLHESGSIFVQIGDENVHRVRCLMDEVFGEDNYISGIVVSKTGSIASNFLGNVYDTILWYAKDKGQAKYRSLFAEREERDEDDFSPDPILSSGNSAQTEQHIKFCGSIYSSGLNHHWKTHSEGMKRLIRADRVVALKKSIRYKRYYQDFPVKTFSNIWSDSAGATNMIYVVQTATSLIQRCILMTTDPGDLVLDPTCGSGTTAYVAEQWGRRWITVDTSRVALALARARLMGARYPWYLLADSREGAQKEAEISQTAFTPQAHYGGAVRQGFVYERVPHITLKSIANNETIDAIWDKWQKTLEPLRETLNAALKKHWEEWEIPRAAGDGWPPAATKAHADWWAARIARQREIDASIAARADYEYLYDKPYEDKKRVRVAGPFTVESLSPHRMIGTDENGEPLDPAANIPDERAAAQSFENMVLAQLATAGVQQAHKAGRIRFSSVVPRPGRIVCAEGSYEEAHGSRQRRAAIFIGPEFGSVQRADLIAAAEEAAEGGFDILIACAFAYDAHASGLTEHAHIPVLKARMNADLHMAEDLKDSNAGTGSFVVFGEPEIEVLHEPDGTLRARLLRVDVYRPSTREVVSSSPDEIACWFIDTDYDGVSFFVRHAYFLGASDPYKSLRTTLKAEIDADAWDSLHCDTSRPFPRPTGGRFAVKVINHLGDEVLKVFKVE